MTVSRCSLIRRASNKEALARAAFSHPLPDEEFRQRPT